MTSTTRPMRETEIAALAKRCIIDLHAKQNDGSVLTWREELFVTLPDEGQVCADLVACVTNSGSEWFNVIECKARLTNDLIGQAERWIGHSNSVSVAYVQPKLVGDPFYARISECARLGIGRYGIFRRGCGLVSSPLIVLDDCRLLSAAFHATPESGPPAGSAACKRNTASRNQWQAATALLQDGRSRAWKAIVAELSEYRSVSAHQARQALIKGEWLGVKDYVLGGVTMFEASEK